MFLNRAKCHHHLNDITSAIKNYQQSLLLNPNQTNISILLKNLSSGIAPRKQNVINLLGEE